MVLGVCRLSLIEARVFSCEFWLGNVAANRAAVILNGDARGPLPPA
jgi:hypothetical protein